MVNEFKIKVSNRISVNVIKKVLENYFNKENIISITPLKKIDYIFLYKKLNSMTIRYDDKSSSEFIRNPTISDSILSIFKKRI